MNDFLAGVVTCLMDDGEDSRSSKPEDGFDTIDGESRKIGMNEYW